MTDDIGKSFSLDKKDRDILFILSTDARASYAKIGKLTRLKKETVAFRVKQLEEKKIISGYTMLFDFSKLGVRVYKLYLKFKGLAKSGYDSLYDYLTKDRRVGWVAQGNGSWDMVIGFLTDDVGEFYDFRYAFEQSFHEKIAQCTLAVQIQAYFYSRMYLSQEKKQSIRPELKGYSNKPPEKIDDADKKILIALGENSRSSLLEIAKKTELTQRIVGYRIKNLEQKKIILQYRATMNLDLIGHIYVKAFIQLRDITPEKRRAILAFWNTSAFIVHNVESLGEWEIEPEFEIESLQEFYRVMNEFRSRFASNLDRVDSMIIEREHKYRYLFRSS